jgi:arsenate reductase
MAEGFLKSFDKNQEVYSAGTLPGDKINSNAVKVMSEIGIDISSQYPKNVYIYAGDSFDYVITVCDSAKEACPVFTGDVKNRIHLGFEDPVTAQGTSDEILAVYRKVRDEIKFEFEKFCKVLKGKS